MKEYPLIKQLFERVSFRSNGSLDNIKKMLFFLFSPQKDFHSIHIAGTNGKGSVAIKIAKSLEINGYIVGLYTSPHISCFRERIQINGEMILEKEVEDGLDKIFNIEKEQGFTLSFFEVLTVLSFLYFSKKKIDFAVIEAGLGGRFDATNLIVPIISVITSIGYDHMQLLGDSLEEIAMEKAGILKENIPVILGPSVIQRSVFKIIEKLNCPINRIILYGKYCFEQENQFIAKKALIEISKKYPCKCSSIERGIEIKAKNRFEVFYSRKSNYPIVILDVAHNISAFEKLFEKINKHFPNKKVRLVLCISLNKDINSVISYLIKQVSFIYLPVISHIRLESANNLLSCFLKNKYANAKIIELNETEKKSLLSNINREKEVLVITGSFFHMKSMRRFFEIDE
jgi:dihydrofolate synthase/folylpolyglutamate synthase